MKLIKIIFLFTFLLGFINSTFSQEKQNDATWEETLNFIRENIEYSNCNLKWKPNPDTEYYPCTFEITETHMTENSEMYNSKHNGSIKMTKKVRFDEITGVELNNDDFYNLVVKSNNGTIMNVTTEMNGKTDRQKKTSSVFTIQFSSRTTAERFLKAFKHLAYLVRNKEKSSKF